MYTRAERCDGRADAMPPRDAWWLASSRPIYRIWIARRGGGARSIGGARALLCCRAVAVYNAPCTTRACACMHRLAIVRSPQPRHHHRTTAQLAYIAHASAQQSDALLPWAGAGRDGCFATGTLQAEGWLVVPEVLSQQLVSDLEAIYDRHLDGTETAHPEDRPWDGHSFIHQWWQFGAKAAYGGAQPTRKLWGAPYYELIDLPTLAPILAELLSDPEFGHCEPNAPPSMHTNTGSTTTTLISRHLSNPQAIWTYMAAHIWRVTTSRRTNQSGSNGLQMVFELIYPRRRPYQDTDVSVIMELAPIEPGCGGTACLSRYSPSRLSTPT